MKSELELIKEGPFPGRMDLWVEHEAFFHGLHEQIIGELARELSGPLYEMGYNVGRERSLQIANGRIPDIHIQRRSPNSQSPTSAIPYEYSLAADEALADPGVLVEELNLDALTIRDRKTGQLVTVVEVVSPGNKREDSDIASYQRRREQIYLLSSVNVVEIDLTRSYKRLVQNDNTAASPYHVAVFLPSKGVRIVNMDLNDRFKRIALPLQTGVMAFDLHEVYANAYGDLLMASSLLDEARYTLDHLPFPSLLTDTQQNDALATVQNWQTDLAQARRESSS